MKFYYKSSEWKKRFAFFPVFYTGETAFDHHIIWLEWFWERDNGFYTQISVTPPKSLATSTPLPNS
jgi:hypothetical protein